MPDLIANDLHAAMRTSAETFAAQHEGLDFSLSSLPALEAALAVRAKETADTVAAASAYLGETILRAAPPSTLTWIAEGGVESPLLRTSGGARWDPAAKIAKYLARGKSESPAAFAQVVLATLPAPEEPPRPIPEAGAKAVRDFFATPSEDTLRGLGAARSVLYEEEIERVLRECAARPSPLYALFALGPQGKGRQAADLGRLAAREAWRVIALGLGDFAMERPLLAAMLASDAPWARANAAWLLAVWHFQRGRVADGIAQLEAGNPQVRVATLEALLYVVEDARDPLRFAGGRPLRPISELAPAISSAAHGAPKERELALEVMATIAYTNVTVPASESADLTPVLDELLGRLVDGKPAQIERALSALESYLWSVKHGRAPFDARLASGIVHVARHGMPLPGNVKTTKVQIAARSTLEAYGALGDELDATARAEVERARLDSRRMP